MTNEEFYDCLKGSIAGSHDDLEKILRQYTPLINKYSYIKGEMDEDLRQYFNTYSVEKGVIQDCRIVCEEETLSVPSNESLHSSL